MGIRINRPPGVSNSESNEDKDLDLSEEQLISEFCATTPCTLDDIYKVSEYINTKGILEERCFAYQNGQNDAAAASCENLQSKTVKAFKPQLVDQSILAIKRAIQQTGPVYVEMIVHDDFLTYTGGIYSYTTGQVMRNLSLRPGFVYYTMMRVRQDRRILRFRG